MATKGTRLLWVFLASTDLPYGSFLFFEVVIKLRCKKLQPATEAFVPSRFFWPCDTGVNFKIRPGYKAQGLSHEKPRWEDRKKCLRNVRKCLWSCEPVMPYVASSNLGYYSVVYFLTFFLLICVGESLKFVFSGEHSRWRLNLWIINVYLFAQGCITISLVSDEDLI